MQEENFYENFYEDLTATKESGKRRKIFLIIFACAIVVVAVVTSTLIVELKKSDSREINSNSTTKEQPTATKIEIVTEELNSALNELVGLYWELLVDSGIIPSTVRP